MSELNGITIPEVNLSNGAPYEAPPEPNPKANPSSSYPVVRATLGMPHGGNAWGA